MKSEMSVRISGKRVGGACGQAFTLIELLIVVAIIAILAAIAVPNFLEAQTRSKVSRVNADQRTIAVALEAYRVDTNRYPYAVFGDAFGKRLAPLTTPIAYLTSIPLETFYKYDPTPTTYGGTELFYCYVPGNIYSGGSTAWDNALYRTTIYSIASRGPDLKLQTAAYCMAHPIALRDKWNIYAQYDPTNGTISRGDIFRLSSSTLGKAP